MGHQTWPQTYAFAGPAYIEHGLATWWSPEAVERSLHATTVLIAEDGTRPLGTGNIDLRGHVAIIWKLYVVPEAQGTGTGSALLTELVGQAPDLPVRLEYTDGNHRAARFYAAHGFAEVAREPAGRPGWPDTVWLERTP
ncbi:GNAT family N-acetyltransferase [Actinoplanes solisilvae]|uniref:GNAT family N-acetyltransferase n=1 Tax=Actinoplanes solisilvae TaxID=2486853 RepID=UPI000FDB70B9